jgi:hypothetical protein
MGVKEDSLGDQASVSINYGGAEFTYKNSLRRMTSSNGQSQGQ